MSYELIGVCGGGGGVWPSLFSRALLRMSVGVCVIRKVRNTPTEQTMDHVFTFCRFIATFLLLYVFVNEMRAINCSLCCCLKDDLGLLLLCVWFLKRPFLCIIFDSTRIWVLRGMCNLRMLLASSHYFCFVFFHYFFFVSRLSWKRMIRDTFTLFISFLDGESKNSKRKSSAFFFSLNLTSNSLEEK